MTKLIFSILVLLGTANSILSQKVPATYFIKSPELKNVSRKIDFYYWDLLKGNPFTINTAKDTTVLFIKSPILLVSAYKQQEPYLIKPGESIIVSIDNNGHFILSIDGNPQRSKELRFFKQLANETGPMFDPTSSFVRKAESKKVYEESQEKIATERNRKITFLRKYQDTCHFANTYYKMAWGVIDNIYLNYKLMLLYNNRHLFKAPGEFKDSINHIGQTIISMPLDINIFSVRVLSYFVNIYNTISTDTFIENMDDYEKKRRYILAQFHNPIRDYMLSLLLYEAGFVDKIQLKNSQIDAYYHDVKDNNYTSYLREILQNENITNKLAKNAIIGLGDTVSISFSDMLKNNKGNIIILDFWASWCSPCREEIPDMIKIQRQYLDKNIKFISLSIDNNRMDWERACEEEKLHSNNNFWIPYFTTCPMKTLYNIQPIPRYILLDKNGKVILEDAPRPSSPEFKKMIDVYLKKLI